MTHVVVRMYERARVPVSSPDRFRVEVLFSPGASVDPISCSPPVEDHTLPVCPRWHLERDGGITLEEAEAALGPFSTAAASALGFAGGGGGGLLGGRRGRSRQRRRLLWRREQLAKVGGQVSERERGSRRGRRLRSRGWPRGGDRRRRCCLLRSVGARSETRRLGGSGGGNFFFDVCVFADGFSRALSRRAGEEEGVI